MTEVFDLLPEGEQLYPEDVTTTQTERFFIGEHAVFYAQPGTPTDELLLRTERLFGDKVAVLR